MCVDIRADSGGDAVLMRPPSSQRATSPNTSNSSTMNIDRRGFLVASSSALVLGKTGLPLEGHEQQPVAPAPRELESGLQAREVAVYTTADKTNYRLSVTARLTFKPMGQPLETQT